MKKNSKQFLCCDCNPFALSKAAKKIFLKRTAKVNFFLLKKNLQYMQIKSVTKKSSVVKFGSNVLFTWPWFAYL